MSPWTPFTISWPSSGPAFCVVWLSKMHASGWWSLRELSSFVPWFFQVCVSECSRNGSGVRPYLWVQEEFVYFRQSTIMRDSVLLNSWNSFLLTLPSIYWETCVICSSLILGTDVIRDWPFPGCSSCVSRVTAANFRLFLNVAIFLKGKCYANMKTELVFIW